MRSPTSPGASSRFNESKRRVPPRICEMGCMYDCFLVPLDGSPLAECACAPAAELARQCSAEIVFLRVCSDNAELSKAVDYLERVSREAGKEGLKVRGEAYLGEPTSRIVQAAREESVDLIIMSSHGRTGLARSVFGSVAESVMRQSSCPVMVVRGGLAAGPGGAESAEVAV